MNDTFSVAQQECLKGSMAGVEARDGLIGKTHAPETPEGTHRIAKDLADGYAGCHHAGELAIAENPSIHRIGCVVPLVRGLSDVTRYR